MFTVYQKPDKLAHRVEGAASVSTAITVVGSGGWLDGLIKNSPSDQTIIGKHVKQFNSFL